MHWFNATRSLFPTTAICAGMKMADQAVQHIDDAFRKHHPAALLTLPHRLLPSSQEFCGSCSARSIFAAKIKSLSVRPLIL